MKLITRKKNRFQKYFLLLFELISLFPVSEVQELCTTSTWLLISMFFMIWPGPQASPRQNVATLVSFSKNQKNVKDGNKT